MTLSKINWARLWFLNIFSAKVQGAVATNHYFYTNDGSNYFGFTAHPSFVFWISLAVLISCDINPLYLPSTQQTDNVSDEVVTAVEHLAAIKPDIFLRSWWKLS